MAPTGPRTAKNLFSKAPAFVGALGLAAISTLTTISNMHSFVQAIFLAITLTNPADELNAFLSVCSPEPFKAISFLSLFIVWYLAYLEATPAARQALLAADDWPLAEAYKLHMAALRLKSPSRRTTAAAAAAARAAATSPPPTRNDPASATDSDDDEPASHAAAAAAAAENTRSQLAGQSFIADVKLKTIVIASMFLLALGSPVSAPIRGIFLAEIAPMVALLVAAMDSASLIAFLDTAALRAFTNAADYFVAGSRRRSLTGNLLSSTGSQPANPLNQLQQAHAQDAFIVNEGLNLMTETLSLAASATDDVMLNSVYRALQIKNSTLHATTSLAPAIITPPATTTAANASAAPTVVAASPPAAITPPPPVAPLPSASAMDQLRATFGVPAAEILNAAEIAGGLPFDAAPAALPPAGADGGMDHAPLSPRSTGALPTSTASALLPMPTAAATPPTAAVAVAPLTAAARLSAYQANLPAAELYMKAKLDRVSDNIPSRNLQPPGQDDPLTLKVGADGQAVLTAARPRC